MTFVFVVLLTRRGARFGEEEVGKVAGLAVSKASYATKLTVQGRVSEYIWL